MRLAAAALGLLLGCSSAPPPGPAGPASGPAPASELSEALISSCQATCERRAQARAVAAQQITLDCAQRCAAVRGWPRVEVGPAARRQIGQRVRILGWVEGLSVRLEDGVQVRLQTAGPLPVGRAWIAGALRTELEGFVLDVEHAAPAS